MLDLSVSSADLDELDDIDMGAVVGPGDIDAGDAGGGGGE